MNLPKQIVLVRHGESEGNVVSRDDVSWPEKPNHAFTLTVRGREQAERAGAYLRRCYGTFDAYFCSTFARTQETLGTLYPEARPLVDARLDELWRGVWHTMPAERMREWYPDERRIRAREGEYHYRPPGGESGQDVELRIHSFLQSLRMEYADARVLVAAHGNWMLLFKRLVTNAASGDFERWYRAKPFPNCAVLEYGKGLGTNWSLSETPYPA